MMDHTSEACAHASTICAHISSLEKISGKATMDAILRAMGRPLMQLNIPECYVNPASDLRPKTTTEEQKVKLAKTILPSSDSPGIIHLPSFGPTRLLASVVWLHLKHKFLNEGITKEGCSKFEVRPKQLSKIFSGSKYRGGPEHKKDTKGLKLMAR